MEDQSKVLLKIKYVSMLPVCKGEERVEYGTFDTIGCTMLDM